MHIKRYIQKHEQTDCHKVQDSLIYSSQFNHDAAQQHHQHRHTRLTSNRADLRGHRQENLRWGDKVGTRLANGLGTTAAPWP
ncbi:unnamed protein product [Urochloa humidicola]